MSPAIATQFRAHPKLGPDIQPHDVFVARRNFFEVTIRANVLTAGAKGLVFEALPLREFGWDANETLALPVGTSPDGWPVWRMRRT